MIKEWFLDKNFTEQERYVIKLAAISGELTVIEETEKAVRFQAKSDFGTIKFWCPKSCIYTEEERAERAQRKAEKIGKGLSYNEKLLFLAKENHIKGVRKGMKTVTLITKLEESGITVPERD